MRFSRSRSSPSRTAMDRSSSPSLPKWVVASRVPAVARVTRTRHVPGRAGLVRRRPCSPDAVVIHDGTTRCHTWQLPRQTLTQVVNRHDRSSPSFQGRSVGGTSRSARRCTAWHAMADGAVAAAGRAADTVRHRSRVLGRTRPRPCLNLKSDLQVRCAVSRLQATSDDARL